MPRARPQNAQAMATSNDSGQSLSIESLFKSATGGGGNSNNSRLKQPRMPPSINVNNNSNNNDMDDEISYANTQTMVSSIGDPTTITAVAKRSSIFNPDFDGTQQRHHDIGDFGQGGYDTEDDGDFESVFEDEFRMDESSHDFDLSSGLLEGEDGGGGAHRTSAGGSPQGGAGDLAQLETRQIGWLRGGVLSVLLVATALVSLAIFYNTRLVEIEYFEGQFADYSDKVADRFALQLRQTLSAMDHLGDLYTTTAEAQAQQQLDSAQGIDVLVAKARQFPLVTLPHFEVRGDSVRQKLAHGTQWIGFVPIVVNDATRMMWETYSRHHSYWVQDGLRQEQLVDSNEDDQPSQDQSSEIDPFIDPGTDTSSAQRDVVTGSGNVGGSGGGTRRKRRQLQDRQRRLQKEEIVIDKNDDDNNDTSEPTVAPFEGSSPPDENDVVGGGGNGGGPTGPGPTSPPPNNAPNNGGSDWGKPDGSEMITKPTLPPAMAPPTVTGNNGPTPPIPPPSPTPPIVMPTLSPPPPRPTVSFPLPEEGQEVQVSANGVSGRVYYLEEEDESGSVQASTPNTTTLGGKMRRVVQPLGTAPYAPIWQNTPVIPGLVNYNLFTHPQVGPELKASLTLQKVVVGKVLSMTVTDESETSNNDADPLAYFLSDSSTGSAGDRGGGYNPSEEPRSKLFVPVLLPINDDYEDSSGNMVVAVVTAVVIWRDFFVGVVPFPAQGPIVVVLENKCGQQFSYELLGQSVRYLGIGDLHERKWGSREESISFSELIESYIHRHSDGSFHYHESNATTSSTTSNDDDDDDDTGVICPFRLRIFPTQDLHNSYRTWKPIIYTVGVVLTFIFTAGVFGGYDYLVERRQKLVLETAVKSSAVVSSLFPAVVRDRLFAGASPDGAEGAALSGGVNVARRRKRGAATAKRRIKTFLDEGGRGRVGRGSKPIADLFPYCTVLFADISGFTAWSSVREPSQVFILLETIYRAFDTTAKKRSVFKVETIGDCYVAVTGLPDPQEDHPIRMAKFAYECMHKMNKLAEHLEQELGPDTGDLKMRFGLHSGPVTAGVLRGEKSRFQLFGDTVNTASRMESLGKPEQIHCSQATADLIIEGGKSHWLCPRDEIVKAKGKGEIQTYWIDPRYKQSDADTMNDSWASKGSKRNLFKQSMSTRSMVWGDSKNFVNLSSAQEAHRHQRLIDWNIALLSNLLKQILARRQRWDPSRMSIRNFSSYQRPISTNPIDEVAEAIVMPRLDVKSIKTFVDPESIDLSSAVVSQLKSYVTTIACMYKDDNPFHNFEHASHVTMSANKMLKRVVAPDDVLNRKGSTKTLLSNLHNYTYGITSDPLTQFALVFSALIHDVDHAGVSNFQLIKEKTNQAMKYKDKSVAEQNSVDLSWNLLMEEGYDELRKTIYSNETEFRRFRSLVVNSVIATDIFDKELKNFRNNRWERAFHQGDDNTNLKATIVIEHVIQASDVSHTMQHWHVYQKWNERLFREMYSAYRSGRGGDKDPSEGWYKGELWFFDNYVIPLAQKLKECGVFGVASAECLTYAMDNRREWESKGEDIVLRMLENYGKPKWVESSHSVGSNSEAS